MLKQLHKLLTQLLANKKQAVLRLNWEKAMLERKIHDRQQETPDTGNDQE